MGAAATADFDLSKILGSLSAEDTANIAMLADKILGTNGQQTQAQQPVRQAAQQTSSPPVPPMPPLSDIGLPDLSVLSRLAPLLGELNRRDERADFIMALKPLLSEERRQKADEAVKIIRLVSALPLLKEQGLV